MSNTPLLKRLLVGKPFWRYLFMAGGLGMGALVFLLDTSLKILVYSSRDTYDGLVDAASDVFGGLLRHEVLPTAAAAYFGTGCVAGLFVWLSFYTFKCYGHQNPS